MKPSEYALADPIAAIATALAPAALGIVRCSGAGCVGLLAPLFSRPDALRGAAGNTVSHGWLHDAAARPVDEVMIAVYRAPKSFTGEESAEIVCHGGTATVLAVYRLLVASGFRAAERGEFSFRSFANGKADLSRAEAVREIIGAETDAARARAANRLAGSLSAEIDAIKKTILGALAAIEVEIEYPEDEETTAGAFDSAAVRSAAERLRGLESTWAAEQLYQNGASIVLAGRTNAGKSSLFNAFLKEDRAIVSAEHGTTRDWLESRADFDGIPVRIFDTAGLRMTADAIEAEGVRRSRALASEADLVLYLVDAREGLADEDRDFLRKGRASPVILVWNKADRGDAKAMPGASDAACRAASGAANGVVGARATLAVSAKRGTGIAELVRESARLLAEARGGATERACALGTERQKEAVRAALGFLSHALEAAGEGFPMDAVAQDLEDAISSLGEITGEVTSADILDAVFSGFCVGK
jgi:tRNA modification GTPase